MAYHKTLHFLTYNAISVHYSVEGSAQPASAYLLICGEDNVFKKCFTNGILWVGVRKIINMSRKMHVFQGFYTAS